MTNVRSTFVGIMTKTALLTFWGRTFSPKILGHLLAGVGFVPYGSCDVPYGSVVYRTVQSCIVQFSRVSYSSVDAHYGAMCVRRCTHKMQNDLEKKYIQCINANV